MDDGKGPVQVVHGSTASDAPAAPFGAHVVPVLCGVLLAFTGLAALVWLWADSVPGGHFLIRIALALGGLVLGFTWCCLAVYVAARGVWGPPVRGGVALLATAAVVLATAAMTVGHVPLRLRFELSRGAFDQVVQDGPDAVDRRVGWYDVTDIDVEGDETYLGASGSWGGTSGFVRAPDGMPEWLADEFRGVSTLDLGGGWYAYWTGVD
jgi:hypothetical protein